METKTCPKCTQTLPLSAFNKNRQKPQGVQSRCRECQRIADREVYKNSVARRSNVRERARKHVLRNRRFVWDYLATHSCVDCGEADPIVLDFDHFERKTRTISDLVRGGVSIAKLECEMAKCDVRCANCHRRKTACELGYYQWVKE